MTGRFRGLATQGYPPPWRYAQCGQKSAMGRFGVAPRCMVMQRQLVYLSRAMDILVSFCSCDKP